MLQVAVVQLPALQGLFDTTGLSAGQWTTAAAGASSVLWAEELRTAWVRRVRAG